MRAALHRLGGWLGSLTARRPAYSLPSDDPAALTAIVACALIGIARSHPLPLAAESYRLAAGYGSTDALGFYGAALFQQGMTEKIGGDADWREKIFQGLALMEQARAAGAPTAAGVLDHALEVMPATLVADWRSRVAMGAAVQ